MAVVAVGSVTFLRVSCCGRLDRANHSPILAATLADGEAKVSALLQALIAIRCIDHLYLALFRDFKGDTAGGTTIWRQVDIT